MSTNDQKRNCYVTPKKQTQAAETTPPYENNRLSLESDTGEQDIKEYNKHITPILY